jgi:alkylation response protein AidB-like acyl-CoA dehydrogenase
MNFELSEEHQDLRSAIESFAGREVSPELIRHCEETRTPPLEAFRKLAKLGWLELGLPQGAGGVGDYVGFAVVLETLSRAYVPLADLTYRCAVHGGSTIGSFGTDKMKAELLPKIAAGEVFCVNGITEPGTGADAASVQTRAVLDGDSWVINGSKTFNTGMLFSDFVVCYTRTDPEAPKHKGITAIFVPVDAPGITVTPLDTTGYRTLVTSSVTYDDVRVPAENVLGEVNGGWQVMMGHLEKERFGLCAITLGATKRVLDISTKYANDRTQFGRPIGSFQAISHLLADIQIDVAAGHLLTYELAWRLTEGLPCRRESAIAKAHLAQTYKNAADSGVQVFGAYGYVNDSEANRHWRDSRLHTIAGGSLQVQKNIIARELGLPRSY